MTIGHTQRAIGLLPSRQDAEYALTELRHANFPMNKVSVIAEDQHFNHQGSHTSLDRQPYEPNEAEVKGGTETGAIAGAATGGLVGLIGGLGLLAIPGIGVAAELGLLLGSTLLGAGFGAAGGGLVGALIGWGIPEAEAKYYDERVALGDYLIVIEASNAEVTQAESLINARRLRDWHVYEVPVARVGR
ncbi:MAG TPA: DUF1269 domain-containing protein [Crinalium sp.]